MMKRFKKVAVHPENFFFKGPSINKKKYKLIKNPSAREFSFVPALLAKQIFTSVAVLKSKMPDLL